MKRNKGNEACPNPHIAQDVEASVERKKSQERAQRSEPGVKMLVIIY